MNSIPLPSLLSLSDWICQIDEHAQRRLQLVDQVNQVLLAEVDGNPERREHRRGLADQLERWRYQHWNERIADTVQLDQALCERDHLLLDALDLHANRLRGGEERPPRASQDAIRDRESDSPVIADLHRFLDLSYPLDALASRAAERTNDHFSTSPTAEAPRPGARRILLYAPLYVSSRCVNHCTYCGFRYPLQITRSHLELDEVLSQARILKRRGFQHQLLVAGDYPSQTTTEYFAQLIDALTAEGLQISIEIAAQSTESYARLVDAGACGLTLYQETYDQSLYGGYHVRGPKASYPWRLEAPERAAEAGMARIGLGVLLGLGDPAADVMAMLRHAAYLKQRFPDMQLALSLPRIHEAPEGFEIPFPVSDGALERLYCVCRLAAADAELVLSTRESPELRRRLARLCITQMSAGSCTTPGGYQERSATVAEDFVGAQFPVSDHRSADEVASQLRRDGFDVRWSFPGQPLRTAR